MESERVRDILKRLDDPERCMDAVDDAMDIIRALDASCNMLRDQLKNAVIRMDAIKSAVTAGPKDVPLKRGDEGWTPTYDQVFNAQQGNLFTSQILVYLAWKAGGELVISDAEQANFPPGLFCVFQPHPDTGDITFRIIGDK